MGYVLALAEQDEMQRKSGSKLPTRRVYSHTGFWYPLIPRSVRKHITATRGLGMLPSARIREI